MGFVAKGAFDGTDDSDTATMGRSGFDIESGGGGAGHAAGVGGGWAFAVDFAQAADVLAAIPGVAIVLAECGGGVGRVGTGEGDQGIAATRGGIQ